MTYNEFISSMQSRGVRFYPPATTASITMTSAMLQEMRAAMLPRSMIEFYSKYAGAEYGSGYIFGPDELKRDPYFPIPSLIDINSNMSHISSLRGKTIFGRNDLFFFAFDSFGVFSMLDNTTLRPLREYDTLFKAMTDCLVVGKI